MVAHRVSVHLCGERARRVMGGGHLVLPLGVKRVQLNGFSDYRLPILLCAERAPEVEFILQCNTLDAIEHVGELRHRNPNVVALWDLSGGTGKDDWSLLPMPGFCGYAGGITEHNVVEKINDVLMANDIPALADNTFWIDLESGARTDDKFDVDKVRRILELTKPFVSAP
jgi:hypothetical protein